MTPAIQYTDTSNIVIVDDNPDNLRMISSILQNDGYNIRPVTSSGEALEIIERLLPDLILLDIRMPGMDGFELCRILKSHEKTRNIPVIFISALNETEEKVKAFNAGGVDFITKPFHPDEILARVQTQLTSRRVQKEIQQLNDELEERVKQRTSELEAINWKLRDEIAERKRIERKLKESEERLDLALSGANEGIYDWKIDKNSLYLDSRFYTMAGYHPYEFPQENDEVVKRIHKVDFNQLEAELKNMLAGDLNGFEVEFRFLRKDGSYMWIQSKGKVVSRDDREKPKRFIGTHTDITARKMAEEALRENEQLLTNILESMDEGVIVVDSDFTYSIFNKSMEDFSNTPRKEVLGKRPWDVFPSLKNTSIEENMKRAMNGETAGDTEVHIELPKNPDVWCRDSFSPLKDADGKIVGIVGVVSDITQQKRDEVELRRLRNYLANIIDSMPSILVAVDRKGRVTLWNQQTVKTTGISVSDARSRLLREVFPRLGDIMESIEFSIRERRVISLPKVARKVDQETRFEDITIFPLVGNGVAEAVIRVDDETQQVRMEEMMIQGEKMLSVGGLAAGMAHEINNPLAGILQNASVLESRLTGELPANHKAAEAAGTTMAAIRRYLALRKLPDMIENIRTSGSMAAAIVKNMLSFARKSDKVTSSNDLGTLLDRTIELLRTDYDMKKRYDFKKIELIREYDPSAPPVPCESSKIQQVFMNILKNGAEAMTEMAKPPCPPVFILRVKDDGAWVRAEIEDNGPGMEERIRRRIFEPFFTTKPVGMGTGLGLSVSYFIVTENHGGQMSVQVAKDGGSCFVIRLPKGGRSESS